MFSVIVSNFHVGGGGGLEARKAGSKLKHIAKEHVAGRMERKAEIVPRRGFPLQCLSQMLPRGIFAATSALRDLLLFFEQRDREGVPRVDGCVVAQISELFGQMVLIYINNPTISGVEDLMNSWLITSLDQQSLMYHGQRQI